MQTKIVRWFRPRQTWWMNWRMTTRSMLRRFLSLITSGKRWVINKRPLAITSHLAKILLNRTVDRVLNHLCWWLNTCTIITAVITGQSWLNSAVWWLSAIIVIWIILVLGWIISKQNFKKVVPRVQMGTRIPVPRIPALKITCLNFYSVLELGQHFGLQLKRLLSNGLDPKLKLHHLKTMDMLDFQGSSERVPGRNRRWSLLDSWKVIKANDRNGCGIVISVIVPNWLK